MNDVVAWALRLILGALILMPVIGGIGFAWIDRWYKAKAEYAARCTMAQAEALKIMAERAKNKNVSE